MCELYFDGDMAFMSEDERTARKEHVCSCCGGTIKAGQKYIAFSYKYDGDIGSEKCCAPCNRVRLSFGDDHDRQYPFPSSLTECMDQCVADRDPGYQRWAAMLSRIRRRGKAAT